MVEIDSTGIAPLLREREEGWRAHWETISPNLESTVGLNPEDARLTDADFSPREVRILHGLLGFLENGFPTGAAFVAYLVGQERLRMAEERQRERREATHRELFGPSGEM